MKHTRQKFQGGSLRKVARKTGHVWEYRYRDHSQPGSPMRQRTLSMALYPTESKALAALQPMLIKINGEEAFVERQHATFRSLVDLFIEEERLIEVKNLRPGETLKGDNGNVVHYSTASSYLSILTRYIKPKWGANLIHEVKPKDVDKWLKSLAKLPKPGQQGTADPLSPKTKGNIKALMYRLFERAMLLQLMPLGRNPMELVEIKGVSKRQRRPLVLTIGQYHAVVERLFGPYQVMVQVAMCLGLRVSEILALKWSDFDFEDLTLQVVRAVVHGRVNDVKTECSEGELPLDPAFVEVMLAWQARCPKNKGGWVFFNEEAGTLYHASPIQQDYIRKAGRALGLKQDIGWHTFRHSYRSFLDQIEAPVGVQQELMRHAQVATTMNVYGNAQMQSKRKANTQVVKMVLPFKEDVQIAS